MKRLALVLVAGCLACGGSKNAAAPVAPESGGAVMAPNPHDEITQLSQQIDADRAKLQLAEPVPLPETPRVPMATLPACQPPKTERCTASCTVGDSICKNAEKICKLAQELPGDNWAADHCARANKACEDAHAQCCACR